MKDTAADGAIRTLSRVDRAFINLLWPRRVIFTVILIFLTTLESGPYRVTTSHVNRISPDTAIHEQMAT